MPRPRTVDRDHLLAAAAEVIATEGVAALSFGSVATAVGLSRATVQSVFGTKEALVDALLEHWLRGEQQRFEKIAGPAPDAGERVAAHIRTTVGETAEVNSRMVALLAATTGSGRQAASVASWYASRMGRLSARDDDERRRRIAFLAAEGAFFVRHLAGIRMSDAVWRDIFKDLEAFAAGL